MRTIQETSRQAYEDIQSSAASSRSKLFWWLMGKPEGATCEEAERYFGTKPGQSLSPRIRELVQAGRVVDSGQRRPTQSGRQAIVWRVSNEAKAPGARPPTTLDRVRQELARVLEENHRLREALRKQGVPA